MPVFRIDVRSADCTDRFDRIGTLDDACRAAFEFADEISRSVTNLGAVRWVEVYDRNRLELMIEVTTGRPLF
jgi:hypothetical protein